MTTNAGPDPVNRWATEHYGFEDDAAHDGPPPTADPSPPSPTPGDSPRRRRNALATAGVLVASLIAGFGGVAVAADAPDRGAGDRSAVTVRFDGDGDGGRTGDLRGDIGGDLGGDVGGDDARGFGRP